MTVRIGMLLFPKLTQLDLTGPHEVLTRLPNAEVSLVSKTRELVRAGSGLGLVPDVTLGEAPEFDVLFVPGGSGVAAMIGDREVLDYLRAQAHAARYVTAVCTGSLLLGAAGLLEGYEATTHWAFHELLARCGATPVRRRVVVDRNRITGGGVTAGIDFGLRLAAELCGEQTARAISLGLEYDPEPPFLSGSPEQAEPELVSLVRRRFEPMLRAHAAALSAATAAAQLE